MNRINIVSDGLYKAITIGYKYFQLSLCRQISFKFPPNLLTRASNEDLTKGFKSVETEEL